MSEEKRLPSFYVCEEMKKLRAGLNQREIQWEDQTDKDRPPEAWICRTWFEIAGNRWSVIHGRGTYGGFTSISPDHKLLELQAGQETEPVGFLTAAQILKKIDAARNSEIMAAALAERGKRGET